MNTLISVWKNVGCMDCSSLKTHTGVHRSTITLVMTSRTL